MTPRLAATISYAIGAISAFLAGANYATLLGPEALARMNPDWRAFVVLLAVAMVCGVAVYRAREAQ